MGDYFWQEWARHAEGDVDSKSPDMSDVDGNYALREWLDSSDDDDGEAYPPSDDDVNEYFLRQWIRRRDNEGAGGYGAVPPEFELERPDDAPHVKPFDIRPALLGMAARENTDSFDDWRRDNDAA
ncbi:Uncharacterized protein PBTT_10112 [Plasmodiophora brassicae]